MTRKEKKPAGFERIRVHLLAILGTREMIFFAPARFAGLARLLNVTGSGIPLPALPPFFPNTVELPGMFRFEPLK